MLKFTIAASLLAMTLSVDAFANNPVAPDETGKTTTAHRGPNTNRQDLENAMEAWLSDISRLHLSFNSDDLRTTGNLLLDNSDLLPIDQLLEELRTPPTPELAGAFLLLTALLNHYDPERNEELLNTLPGLTERQTGAFNFLSAFRIFLNNPYGTEDGENTTEITSEM